ncbi:hypothetical protein HY405_01725 [Candidatus Microgenomates bacterium]|nr:hypothetical protein [Candidatus Microgenomates bacterium]
MGRYFLGAATVILLGIFAFSLSTTTPMNEQKQLSNNQPSVLQTPTPTPKPEKYPLHRDIVATVFWVGEKEGPENDYISNDQSAWDRHWMENFGGVDTPDERNGWFPKAFIPKENPFYIALPYTDFERRERKENAVRIPWYKKPVSDNVSLVKNRWIKIYYEDKVCYGQWEDAGPGEPDDLPYVFGNEKWANEFGVGAGIDLSPAVRNCLGVGSVSKVDWRFVDDEDVPPGPWKIVITKSGVTW